MTGRAFLVTGAASGIGQATAVALAAGGESVGIGTYADDPHDAAETLDIITSAGGSAVVVSADVRDTVAMNEACQAMAARFGRLDGAVANAGWLKRAPLDGLTDDLWQRVLDVDLTGVMRTVRAVAPHLPSTGAVVCISSIAGGVFGWAGHTPYSAAKAGVVGFVRTAALELAPRPLHSAGGEMPHVDGILEKVQIDHTVVDLVVVDQRERQPVGRPYLTVGLDEVSRCVVGMVVTLEPPAATSVGLCLAHMAGDKRAWLEGLGVDVVWPMAGKPGRLYLDNASEFKSEALRRGCEQHGIELSYRPLGRPHYGGIIERIIGTVMQRVHELPGTTFSNPTQRGGYDSDSRPPSRSTS